MCLPGTITIHNLASHIFNTFSLGKENMAVVIQGVLKIQTGLIDILTIAVSFIIITDSKDDHFSKEYL